MKNNISYDNDFKVKISNTYERGFFFSYMFSKTPIWVGPLCRFLNYFSHSAWLLEWI